MNTAPLLLAVFLLLQNALPAENCMTGTATRHDAFDAVFRTFPERQRGDVDGYIGVKDCADVGKLFWLTAGESAEGAQQLFLVSAADCLSSAHIAGNEARWQGKWVADISLALWQRASLPSRPTSVILCFAPEVPDDRSNPSRTICPSNCPFARKTTPRNR